MDRKKKKEIGNQLKSISDSLRIKIIQRKEQSTIDRIEEFFFFFLLWNTHLEIRAHGSHKKNYIISYQSIYIQQFHLPRYRAHCDIIIIILYDKHKKIPEQSSSSPNGDMRWFMSLDK